MRTTVNRHVRTLTKKANRCLGNMPQAEAEVEFENQRLHDLLSQLESFVREGDCQSALKFHDHCDWIRFHGSGSFGL
jgi:hypothetical protein